MENWAEMQHEKTKIWDKMEKTNGEGKGTEILNARRTAVED